MVAFAVIVPTVLGQDPRKWSLAEQDHLRQTLLLDGANPSFSERTPDWVRARVLAVSMRWCFKELLPPKVPLGVPWRHGPAWARRYYG